MVSDFPQGPAAFVAAETVEEALARIYALTGATPQSRGEKRALVALRDALGLDVDVVRTNAVMAEHLAHALDIRWFPGEFTERNKVNLKGLNALLRGAYGAYSRGGLTPVPMTGAPELTGSEWANFTPAVSKIEAVTRIAELTDSPPEWLGPGSKEHKSVLVNLADRALPGVPLDRSSKTRMARDIADALGVGWGDDCYSTGETISLKGLNTILAGAERKLGRLGSDAAAPSTAEAEGAALAAALFDGWRGEPWDGRRCVLWMKDEGFRGYNDNEWQGWYYEARGRQILNSAFRPQSSPPRSKYGNTVFDYRLGRVWDLKAHTAQQFFPESARMVNGGSNMILNDAEAIRECVAEQGVGFLVLCGRAEMDEGGSFVEWHRAFKAGQAKVQARSNSGKSRTRKAGFLPLSVEAFWIPNTQSLKAAIAAGQLFVRAQGRQPPRGPGQVGAPRADKFHMNVSRARQSLRVACYEWHSV